MNEPAFPEYQSSVMLKVIYVSVSFEIGRPVNDPGMDILSPMWVK